MTDTKITVKLYYRDGRGENSIDIVEMVISAPRIVSNSQDHCARSWPELRDQALQLATRMIYDNTERMYIYDYAIVTSPTGASLYKYDGTCLGSSELAAGRGSFAEAVRGLSLAISALEWGESIEEVVNE